MEDERSSKLRFLIFIISGAALLGVFLLSQKVITYFGQDDSDYFSIDSLDGAEAPLVANIIGDKIGDKPLSPKLSPIMSPKPSLSPIMSPNSNAAVASVSPTVTPTPAASQSTSPRPMPTSSPSSSPTPASPTPNLTPTSTPAPTTTPTPESPISMHSVVINEIAWMGTQASSADEWLELYNPNNLAVDLSGWTLKSADQVPSIILKGVISAKGYYLLERTDNETVDVNANLIYTGALSNDPGERLVLGDGHGRVVDSIDCSSAWLAGDNGTKSSMERVNPLAPSNDKSNWKSNDGSIKNGLDSKGNAVNGTPSQRNSAASF